MASFTCSHCGRWYRHEKGLKRDVRSSHMNQPPSCSDQCGRSFNRADNLQNHVRNCTGRGVVVPTVAVPAAKNRCTCVAPERLQFKLQKTRGALEGNVQQITVNMKEAKGLPTLEKAITVFKPVMMDFQQKPSAYKFQIAVSIVFHKAVDPAVVTQPPVVLTSEMVAVYADTPPLNEVNRQLLNFIEMYEQNGSGWVFTNFVSLQLSLRHLNPLRASAFVLLPNWIQTHRAVVNIRGTGNDCFKWAVLAGMHPVDANGDRMSQYNDHIGKYDDSFLHFPVPLSSVGSFATTNNMSINVYGVDDDKKVIFPIRVSSTLVPDMSICYCLNVMVFSTIPPLETLAD